MTWRAISGRPYVKVGGEGGDGDAISGGARLRRHKLSNFAALCIGGKDRSGPTDPSELANGAIGFLARLRGSAPGRKLETLMRKHQTRATVGAAASTTLGGAGAVATLAALPSSQSDAMGAAVGAASANNRFKDRAGHALLHGTFRLPSVIPDRDFIWDQVAMRLPTGSVLIAGRSVEEEHLVPCEKAGSETRATSSIISETILS